MFCGHLLYFSHFGTLYHEISGNPGPKLELSVAVLADQIKETIVIKDTQFGTRHLISAASLNHTHIDIYIYIYIC
jgi:hypothetical protein